MAQTFSRMIIPPSRESSSKKNIKLEENNLVPHLNIKGPVGTARSRKVDVLHVVIFDKNRRLVHKDEATLQGVHEPGGRLERTGNGRGTRMTDKLSGHGDFPARQDFHHAGDQLERGPLHFFLQLVLILIL